jgi:hypothetical protein
MTVMNSATTLTRPHGPWKHIFKGQHKWESLIHNSSEK